ncbi:MAG: discoidin domain-containing protein, partial [Thomasclavelia spiroformis]
MLATTMFPIQTIGSKTNAFIGYVDDLRLGKNDTFASTMALDYAIWNGEAVLTNMANEQLRTVIDEAKSVLTEYAPSKATVDSYVSQINDLLSQMDYKKADYSRLNAYLALTKDLSEFTDESVASVNQVIEGIRLNLPVQLQSTVDAYEKALVQALDNLELKDKTDLNLVDSSKLTATASSYQQDGSNPSNVLDGSTSTMWHSAWNITTMPHYIDLEIDESTEIKGLIYTPRQSGSNGNLLEYQIQVSDNGVDYETIATGTLENNAQAKTINFAPVTTKHVRLVYVRAVNNNASASEISLIQAKVNPDIEGLQAIIDNAKSMSNVGYTDETWTAFQDVIKEAEALVNLENPGANEVEAMKQTIASSIVALRLSEEELVVADKTALQIAVDLADKVTDK